MRKTEQPSYLKTRKRKEQVMTEARIQRITTANIMAKTKKPITYDMSIKEQIRAVQENIEWANKRDVAAVYALCQFYSGKALQLFRRFQTYNTFWTNQTGSAYNSVFSGAFFLGNTVGLFLAHAVEYGIYLELANNRAHEALWPIIKELSEDFMTDLKEIFPDD